MTLIPPKQLYSTKQWLSILGSMLTTCVIWASHFVIEYGILADRGIDIFWVNSVYFGCILGSLLSFIISTRVDHHKVYLFYTILYFSSIICLLLIQNQIAVIVILYIVGFSSGGLMGHLFTHLLPVFPDPKFNGRSMGWGYTFMNLLILLEILAIKADALVLNIIGIGGFLVIVVLTTINGYKDYPEPHQARVKLNSFLRKKENLPFILIAFFWGFFLTIPIYASYHLIVRHEDLLNIDFLSFMAIIFVVMMIGSLPVGILLDRVGRRKVTLFGLLILSVAFLALIFEFLFPISRILFPITIGIGFTMVLPSHSLLLIEIPKREEIQDSISLGYFIMSLGMSSGAILGNIFREAYIDEPMYLSVLLLFFMLIVSIVIAEIDETLPNKEELEWKSSLQYISIMYRSGVGIYSQQLNPDIFTKDDDKQFFLGGALVAVSSIVDEIAEKYRSLRVIQKEGFSILIEESDNLILAVFTTRELKIIRKKMKIFMEEFQSFFKELIDLNITNLTSFLPTKRLVQKHFQYYW